MEGRTLQSVLKTSLPPYMPGTPQERQISLSKPSAKAEAIESRSDTDGLAGNGEDN